MRRTTPSADTLRMGEVSELRQLLLESNLADVSEERLADAIERDGRARIASKEGCSLAGYLSVIPDLQQRPVALDAAIDVSLRELMARSTEGGSIAGAVASLTEEFPDLAEQIGLAATLSQQVAWSPSGGGMSDLASRVGEVCGPVVEGLGPRYAVGPLVGSGSNGAVYEGRDRHLSDEGHQVEVAIKFLHGHDQAATTLDSATLPPSPVLSARRLQARLLDEARRTRRIDHPNVLRVLDYGVSPSLGAFVVSELVRGRDLEQLRTQCPLELSPRRAVELVLQAARGVEAAHASGVLHCDLKPSNILIDHENNLRVADFGTGMVFSASGLRGPVLVGNMAFAAPEQVRMESSALGIPTDVYALGGILVYLLTGQYPNGSTFAEIEAWHDSDDPKQRRELRARGVDQALEAVCWKALAPEPSERYLSASALALDLEAWLADRSVSVWRAPLTARLGRTMRRQRRRVIAGIVALVALCATIGVVVHHRWEAQQARRTSRNLQKQVDEEEEARTRTRAALKELYGAIKTRARQPEKPTPLEIEKLMRPLWVDGDAASSAAAPEPP